MAVHRHVFTLKLEEEAFDKIKKLAVQSHRSLTNYVEYVLLKHAEEAEFRTHIQSSQNEGDR